MEDGNRKQKWWKEQKQNSKTNEKPIDFYIFLKPPFRIGKYLLMIKKPGIIIMICKIA